nr:hypothetical protein [Solanum melongena]WMB96856.1 hypothetical protein [Solanum melongena]WMB97145.1 hypothetical protein [Solanum aethiopicum]
MGGSSYTQLSKKHKTSLRSLEGLQGSNTSQLKPDSLFLLLKEQEIQQAVRLDPCDCQRNPSMLLDKCEHTYSRLLSQEGHFYYTSNYTSPTSHPCNQNEHLRLPYNKGFPPLLKERLR